MWIKKAEICRENAFPGKHVSSWKGGTPEGKERKKKRDKIQNAKSQHPFGHMWERKRLEGNLKSRRRGVNLRQLQKF